MMRFAVLLAAMAALFASVTAQVTLPLTTIPKGPMHFLSLGDWGAVNTDQANVNKQISTYAASFNATMLLSLGDNFYDNGVANSTDSQWNTTYSNVFNASSLNIPWLSIEGNHDHNLGRGQGQIDYYNEKRDSRWVMPSYWYTASYYLQDTATTVQFVMIDTVILCDTNSTNNGSVPYPQQAHYNWINKTLHESTADWIIVVGHYPIFGEASTSKLVQGNLLVPMMKAANVDMYLSGHDHTMQHLQENSTGIQYFVNGNVAKSDSYVATNQTVFGRVSPGFMAHTITGNNTMNTKIIDVNGTIIYQYTQKRINKASGTPSSPSGVANNARSFYDIQVVPYLVAMCFVLASTSLFN